MAQQRVLPIMMDGAHVFSNFIHLVNLPPLQIISKGLKVSNGRGLPKVPFSSLIFLKTILSIHFLVLIVCTFWYILLCGPHLYHLMSKIIAMWSNSVIFYNSKLIKENLYTPHEVKGHGVKNLLASNIMGHQIKVVDHILFQIHIYQLHMLFQC